MFGVVYVTFISLLIFLTQLLANLCNWMVYTQRKKGDTYNGAFSVKNVMDKQVQETSRVNKDLIEKENC